MTTLEHQHFKVKKGKDRLNMDGLTVKCHQKFSQYYSLTPTHSSNTICWSLLGLRRALSNVKSLTGCWRLGILAGADYTLILSSPPPPFLSLPHPTPLSFYRILVLLRAMSSTW